MADEHITGGDAGEIRRQLGAIASSIQEIKATLEDIRKALVADHQKIEKLEATTADDQRKLKELEQTKKNLEMTGRIQVRPVGL